LFQQIIIKNHHTEMFK